MLQTDTFILFYCLLLSWLIMHKMFSRRRRQLLNLFVLISFMNYCISFYLDVKKCIWWRWKSKVCIHFIDGKVYWGTLITQATEMPFKIVVIYAVKVFSMSNCICSRGNKSLINLMIDINDPFDIYSNTQIFPLIKFFNWFFVQFVWSLQYIIFSIKMFTFYLNTKLVLILI